VGLVTATLLLRRQEWLHRRVELVTFEDQGVTRRRFSVDFTVPRWAFNYLGVDTSEPTKIAVPIALFQKGTLVHFNLSDEGSDAVPLLSGSQVGQMAEMALLSAGELVLPSGQVPSEIVSDIRQLATERDRAGALKAQERLFSSTEPSPQERGLLKSHPVFAPLAMTFAKNYMAAVLLDLCPGDRRVIHFAFDEQRTEVDNGRTKMRATFDMLVYGQRDHQVLVLASGAGDAASFHIEAEAPEGLDISSREVFFGHAGKDPDEKVDFFGRAHIHYTSLSASERFGLMLRLTPRSSTLIRAGALTSALTLMAVVILRLQIGDILLNKTSGEAAILLVTPTLLSIYVARANEHPTTTHILWPIRIVATAPGILSFGAAVVLVVGGSDFWSETTLWAVAALLLGNTLILVRLWRRSRRLRRSI
jgi:hypothetical protein